MQAAFKDSIPKTQKAHGVTTTEPNVEGGGTLHNEQLPATNISCTNT
jgi:hypothetical protein